MAFVTQSIQLGRAIEDIAHVGGMFLYWQILCFTLSLWVFHVTRRLPAGGARMISCLPVVVVLLGATPWLIDRCRAPVVVMPLMAICSLSAFKVAAFAIGRGPLTLEQSEWYHCLKKFHIVLSFPIIPVTALKQRRGSCCNTVGRKDSIIIGEAQVRLSYASTSSISSGSSGSSFNKGSDAVTATAAAYFGAKTAAPALPWHAFPQHAESGLIRQLAAWALCCCLIPFCTPTASQQPKSPAVVKAAAEHQPAKITRSSTSSKYGVGGGSSDSSGRGEADIPTSPSTLPAYLQATAWQVALLAVSAHITQHWVFVPLFLRHWFYALLLALELQLVWDFYGLLSATFFGMQAAQSFDSPWLSASFAEYWARRWNLPTTHMLRVLIYDPIMEGRLVAQPQPAGLFAGPVPASAAQLASSASNDCSPKAALAGNTMSRTASDGGSVCSAGSAASSVGDSCAAVMDEANSSGRTSVAAANGSSQQPTLRRWSGAGAVTEPDAAAMNGKGQAEQGTGSRTRRSPLRRFLGVQASFAFSGAWHTLIFYYATGQLNPHWFAFFSLQAPALLLEAAVQKAAKRAGLRIPHVAAVVITNLAVLVFGSTLFCRPIDSSGLKQAFYDNVLGRIPGSHWESVCSKGAAYYW